MRDILQKYTNDDAKRSAVEQKIGDYYESCMDEGAIEKLATKPLASEMDRIAALKSKQELAPELIQLHRQGTDVLFSFASTQDFGDATQVIAEADQGGMGMPIAITT
jgi:endothelin-converting enzyme/putative endopeptidase